MSVWVCVVSQFRGHVNTPAILCFFVSYVRQKKGVFDVLGYFVFRPSSQFNLNVFQNTKPLSKAAPRFDSPPGTGRTGRLFPVGPP